MTTQSHLYKQDDEMKLPSCCEANGYGEDGCNQGKDCPCRIDLRAIVTRRVQEADLRWPRDCAMGEEAANPALVKPPAEAMAIQYAGKEPRSFDWERLVLIVVGVVAVVAVVASFDQKIERLFDDLWPRLVYVASF